MDLFEFLIFLAAVAGAALVARASFGRSTAESVAEKRAYAADLRRIAEDERKTAEAEQRIAEARSKTAAASAARHQPKHEPAAWVGELLTSFGVDPLAIFEDEPPEELARLVPLVRGFLDSGGLERLLGGKPPGGPGGGPGEGI